MKHRFFENFKKNSELFKKSLKSISNLWKKLGRIRKG